MVKNKSNYRAGFNAEAPSSMSKSRTGKDGGWRGGAYSHNYLQQLLSFT